MLSESSKSEMGSNLLLSILKSGFASRAWGVGERHCTVVDVYRVHARSLTSLLVYAWYDGVGQGIDD